MDRQRAGLAPAVAYIVAAHGMLHNRNDQPTEKSGTRLGGSAASTNPAPRAD
jgi:hypothetical protein